MNKFKKLLAVLLTVLMLVSVIPFSCLTTSAATQKTATVIDIQVYDVKIAMPKQNSSYYDVPEFTYKLTYDNGDTVVKSSTKADKNLIVTHNQKKEPWERYSSSNYIDVSYLDVSTRVYVEIVDEFFIYISEKDGIIIIGAWEELGTNIIIPEKINGKPVIAIEGAFRNATSISIPKTVKSIDLDCLTDEYSSYNLKSITVAADNKKFSSYNGILYNKAKTKILAVPNAMSGTVTLAKELKSIGKINAPKVTLKAHSKSKYLASDKYAVYNKKKTEILYVNKTFKGNYTIPASVKKIAENVFENCKNIAVKPSSKSKYFVYKDSVVYNKKKTEILYVNKTIKGTYKMPATVKKIPSNAFESCKKLTSVKFSNAVTEITYAAFNSCTSLKKVTLPNKLKTINASAFQSCSKLENLDLPSTLKTIKKFAFDSSGIKKISIPNKVTSIGDFAFSNCKKLKTVSIGSGLKDFSAQDFRDCNKISKITISSKNKYLSTDKQAVYRKKDSTILFYYKAGQSGYSIKSGTKSIAGLAFSTINAAASIKTLIIPNSVTNLAYDHFFSCEKLTNLTTISFPKKTWSIASYAFEECQKLVSVTIPKAVTFINSSAFENCKNIKHVFYEGSKNQWKKIRIEDGNEYLTKAKIHYNSKGCKHKYSKGADLTCNVCGYFEILPTTRKINSKTYYYVNGKKATSVTGIVKVDGKEKFVKKGVVTPKLDTPKLKVSNTKSGLKLSWSKPTGSNKYAIYRREYKNGKWSKYKKINITSKSNFTDKKVKKGVKYQYSIKASYNKITSKTKYSKSIKKK